MCASMCWALSALVASVSAEGLPVDPAVARAVAALHDRPDDPLAPAELEDALADLGAPALPALFTVLAEGSYACTSTSHAVATHPLTASQSRATFAAISRSPQPAVRDLLARVAELELETTQRIVALELVAAIGERDELSLAAELARPAPDDDRVDLSVQHAAQAAFGRILARDSSALEAVGDLYGRVHDAVRAPLVRGLARAGPASMDVLAALLGRQPDVDGLVLMELGRLSARGAGLADELLRSRVRDRLRAANPVHVRQAITIVGNLRDGAAIDTLVDLLRTESGDVRPRAHEALRAITGLRMKPEYEVWYAWWRAESEWLASSAPDLFVDLHAADPAVVVAALLEIGQHRAHREILAREVTAVLARPEPELASMAASLLGRLAVRRSIPDLREGLASNEPAVRESCVAALRRLTGKDLPADPAAWVGVR